MKWWAQSYLVGIPRIICGFRDDEGVVKNLQTFKTVEIPKETQVTSNRARKLSFCCIQAIVFTYSVAPNLSSCFLVCQLLFAQNDLTLWQPSVCLNFLDAVLTWMREVVVVDDPK